MDEKRTKARTTEGNSTETTAETSTEGTSVYNSIKPIVLDYLQSGYALKGMNLTEYLLARTVALLQDIAATQEGIAQTAQGMGLATSDIADAVQSMDL